MNRILAWLELKHHRIILFYGVFTLSAWWIFKNQIMFALPLIKATSITDLTDLALVKEATLITRWAALYLDHGMQWHLMLKAIHVEDWVFLILGILLSFKVKGYFGSTLIRFILGTEFLLNGILILIVMVALGSIDTLMILNSVKTFAFIEIILSLSWMITLFIYCLRLCFHEYTD